MFSNCVVPIKNWTDSVFLSFVLCLFFFAEGDSESDSDKAAEADSDFTLADLPNKRRGRVRLSPPSQAQAAISQQQQRACHELDVVENMGSACKLALLAISLIALLLLPSNAAAAVTKAIDASRRERLELPESLVGPESVAFDGHDAGPYVSVSDGRVLRWGGEGAGWKTFAYSPSYIKNDCAAQSELPPVATESSCGRPLGLRFDTGSGYLYIADAYMGLMRVGPGGGEATVLATEAGGAPLRFTNGVDVDQVTGDVYFTDSSTTYSRAQHQMVTATGDSTGRVMKYDPRANQVTVLLSGVTYPNGIAISADRTHLVVALTGPCKLLKYWIRGPKAGTSEPFADLPGYPDNVRPDGKGGYWVALHREKNEFPFGVDKHLVAIRLGADGKVLQEMKGPKNVRPTELVERDGGKIYMGSVELPYVGIINST
ncbi:protein STRICTOSIDINE SYNTHASE-LIKE 10-like [Phragmites australis]|uniref:protein STRICTOSIDINE SYNTHASE-LIKE 10-like n=1 Tax=Phragmites australis TaxID=29695 RepID=UPI002D76D4EA|nr:protein STRICTOSIDINE SYNTHASE-LIKE 10-like [Phragmites australis]